MVADFIQQENSNIRGSMDDRKSPRATGLDRAREQPDYSNDAVTFAEYFW